MLALEEPVSTKGEEERRAGEPSVVLGGVPQGVVRVQDSQGKTAFSSLQVNPLNWRNLMHLILHLWGLML